MFWTERLDLRRGSDRCGPEDQSKGAPLRKEADGAMATFAEQVVENNIEQMKRESLDAKTQSMLGENGHHIIGHRVGFVVLVGIVPLGTIT